QGGSLLGHRVLVTGASGGVGHFAVQLAKAAGARVFGMVRRQAHASLVLSLGAEEAFVSEDGVAAKSGGPYHLIVDAAAGQSLGNLLHLIAPGGTLVVLGTAEHRE